MEPGPTETTHEFFERVLVCVNGWCHRNNLSPSQSITVLRGMPFEESEWELLAYSPSLHLALGVVTHMQGGPTFHLFPYTRPEAPEWLLRAPTTLELIRTTRPGVYSDGGLASITPQEVLEILFAEVSQWAKFEAPWRLQVHRVHQALLELEQTDAFKGEEE